MKRVLILLIASVLLMTVSSCDSEDPEIPADTTQTTSNVSESTSTEPLPEEPKDVVDNSDTQITVMTQEYIENNIAEILMISYDGQQPAFEEYNWKNPEIEMINNIIKNGIQQIYNEFMNDTHEREWIEIRSYPFTNDEWLQIVTTYNIYPTYGMSGNLESYNFNKKENRFFMVDDAIEAAGLTEESLAATVKELFSLQKPYLSVDEVTAKGFLIKQSSTQFLLEITYKNDAGDPAQGLYSYIHESNELQELDSFCLFDPNDMDVMNPPLSYASSDHS